MHPEVIKDGPGSCDVCGMPLVRAEELGYMPVESSDTAPPLIIPASAPLVTGPRAVVYVEVEDAERPTYEGREVVLGPRAGGYYIVREGLQEGERVVTNGNFKIDSALQILAKPSMMAREGDGTTGAHDHGSTSKTSVPAEEMTAPAESPGADAPEAFKRQLGSFSETYLAIGTALAADDFDGTRKAVPPSRTALNAVDMKLLEGGAHTIWMGQLSPLGDALAAMEAAGDIEAAQASAREALSAAKSEKQRGQATDLLQRLRR